MRPAGSRRLHLLRRWRARRGPSFSGRRHWVRRRRQRTLMEVARTPSSPPQENLGRELFPARQDSVLPGTVRTEQEEAEGDESARLAEELRAIARHAAELAEVR